MEDIYMKFGMIFIALVVIGLLANFALRTTIKDDFSEQQKIIGDSIKIKEKIERLCQYCLKDGIDQDCFILDAQIDEGELTQNDSRENLEITAELTEGKHLLKIVSENNICVVREFE
jgi:hypothetical protein